MKRKAQKRGGVIGGKNFRLDKSIKEDGLLKVT